MVSSATSGPARILASGVSTTFFGHDLALDFSLSEGPWRVAVRWIATDGGPPSADVTSDPQGCTLTLCGFDGAEGRGSAQPILLGALGDDLLFLHIRSFRYGASSDHTLHYTLFRVATADVGWTSLPDEEGDG
jgi:hypothetical protein